ncbi:hypothetical protein D3C76_1776610 [compost metagenome]
MRSIKTQLPVLLVSTHYTDSEIASFITTIIVEGRRDRRLTFKVVAKTYRNLNIQTWHHLEVLKGCDPANTVNRII